MPSKPDDAESVGDAAAREGAEAGGFLAWARGHGRGGQPGGGASGVREPVSPQPPSAPTAQQQLLAADDDDE